MQLVGEALFAGGEALRAEAAFLITQGAVSGKGHVRSKPGEPPNEEFGTLRAGLNTIQTAPLRVEVESTARHALPLETGTSKMAARPSMGPATQRTRKEIVALVGKAVRRAIREA